LLNFGAFELQETPERLTERLVLQPKLVDNLPEIPVMPETLLRMELGMHEYAVDLGAMSQLVLGDLGATLQILRLAARECGAGDAHPARMEDCISGLGLQSCLKAAARERVRSDVRYSTVFETWAHAREIALACKTLAREQGMVSPDEAYLVGLCHGIGSLPELLGWERPGYGGNSWASVGRRLAERWSLPNCVSKFFSEMRMERGEGRWSYLVREAHQKASRSTIGCPLFNGDRSSLRSHV